jgi:hypothetical protein
MSVIVIKDLAESMELDREAMAAILGGSRSPRPAFPRQVNFRSGRLFSYPGAVARNATMDMHARKIVSMPRK